MKLSLAFARRSSDRPKFRMDSLQVGIAFLAATALLARAATIALWTFEAPGTPPDATAATYPNVVAAQVVSGIAGGVHASASTAWSSPTGNGSAESFSSNNWAIGDYYQLRANTLGYEDIQLSWDQTSSNSGPRDFQLAYSTDGVTFSNFGPAYSVLANASPNPVWNGTTASVLYNLSRDLSAFSGLDNQADVIFRLICSGTTSANGGVLATGGTNRIDNFAITGTPVPEPGVAFSLLGGFATLVMTHRLRRRRR